MNKEKADKEKADGTAGEFEMLGEAAQEAGIKYEPAGADAETVERIFSKSGREGNQISAIKWGSGEPELVFFHGGSQNAHTWDTVALALGVPLLAVDLPGHGHSDWREDHNYTPLSLAEDVAGTVKESAPNAKGVVGMSLGGLTAVMLADKYPKLVRSLMLVDITPGVNRAKAEPILEFISGPVVFDSFDEILEYTAKHNPTRSRQSLIRGIKNNAKEIEGGKWTWRWDPHKPEASFSDQDKSSEQASEQRIDESLEEFSSAWDALKRVKVPVALFKGGESGVVDDSDIEEFLSCQSEAQVVVVPGAGHSIQGDKPVELAALISDFVQQI